MRKVINLLEIYLIIAFVVAGFSVFFAHPQEIKPIPGPIIRPVGRVDLVVTAIYGGFCPDCTCGRTNFGNHYLVEYQEDIKVHVQNIGTLASPPCKLKIEFYDVLTSRRVEITKDVRRLNPGEGYWIIERGEYLYKKSVGIKATVDSTNVVTESNETNNSMTVHECELPPVI